LDADFSEDLAALEALEAIPGRAMTPTERTHKRRRRFSLEAKADEYNELVARYGRPVGDLMVKLGWFPVLHAVELIRAECQQWFMATGERVNELRMAERLGLQCWLWETHGRQRQKHRFKPNKSPSHDIPWPNAPVNWAPRRWFASRIWSSSKSPLQISIARALNQEREKTRAELATEVPSGMTPQAIWRSQDSGWWEDTSVEPINERNHPTPAGFWSVARNPISQKLLWNDRWDPPRFESYEGDHGPSRPFDATVYAYENSGELSSSKAECRRRREAAICGLFTNFVCV